MCAEPRENPPRRSIFAVWRWPSWKWLTLLLLNFGLIGYVLSEAPALYYNNLDDRFLGKLNGILFIYQPCNFLYDQTPLHAPLLKWAELWWVDSITEGLSADRGRCGCKVIDESQNEP